MKIADSHCHLHFNECKDVLSDILDRSSRVGVEKILFVGIDPEDSSRAKNLSLLHEGFFSTIGIHPQLARQYSSSNVYALSKQFDEKVVAIGETGFDFYRTPETIVEQESLFIAHIGLSEKYNLPLVIHDRNAHKDTIRVLDENNGWARGGVFHCFSGDINMARYVLSKGFYLSITGVITYKSADLLRKVADIIPLDRLLIETDAPYLSPVPYRGKMNEPAFLVNVLSVLSEIKKTSIEELSEITSSNFERLFISK